MLSMIEGVPLAIVTIYGVRSKLSSGSWLNDRCLAAEKLADAS